MNKGILVLAAAVTLLSGGCRSTQSDSGTQSGSRTPVKVRATRIALSPVSSNKTYVGTVEAAKSVVITSPGGGRLTELFVKEGEKVKEGQILAQMQSDNVESTLAAAEATLRQAQDANDRINAVRSTGSVSEMQIVEAETGLEKAKSMAAIARKAKEDLTIRAGYDGTVGQIYADLTAELTPASPLIRLIDTQALEITISVPETEVAHIATGSRATVTVPALGDKGFSATLVRKGVVASAISHSYDCALQPAAVPAGLLPGMACKVRFTTTCDEGEIVIPAAVVRSDSEGSFVWTVTPDNTVSKARIATGGYAGKGVVITEGLQPGDMLITEGASKVSTGMRVQIIP